MIHFSDANNDFLLPGKETFLLPFFFVFLSFGQETFFTTRDEVATNNQFFAVFSPVSSANTNVVCDIFYLQIFTCLINLISFSSIFLMRFFLSSQFHIVFFTLCGCQRLSCSSPCESFKQIIIILHCIIFISIFPLHFAG